MKNRTLGVLVLVPAIALVAYFWPRDPALAVASVGSDAAVGAASPLTASIPESKGGATATDGPAVDGPAPDGPAVERSSLPTPSRDRGRTVFRGRCVDERGAPLAQVKVSLNGWAANAKLMEQYRKLHGEVRWSNPEPLLTAADGRFEFCFDPPPPYHFMIDFELAGRVHMRGHWDELDSGVVKDLGDVVLMPGCRVRGRVEDTEGRPIAKVHLHIDRSNDSRFAPRAEVHYRRSAQARTLDDGSFTLQESLPAGPWKLILPHQTLVEPQQLVVPADLPEWSVTLVVKSEKDVPTIRGLVVDELGDPVVDAEIESTPGHGGSWTVRSGRDGSFALRDERKATGSGVLVTVRASREGYEDGQTKEPVPWGADGVRIALRKGLDVRVTVTDQDTGAPILEYGVIAQPTPGRWPRMSSRHGRTRDRGHHPDGVVTISGLRRGPYLLLVDPTGPDWLHSGYHPFEVLDGGPREVAIQLSKGVARLLRVESASGRPVAGTKVELLEPIGNTLVDFRTWLVRLHSTSSSSARNRALFRQEGQTDAQGRFTLRAPPRRGYAVRILGPGHRPQIEHGVELTADAPPLVVRVAAGATLVGRVGPSRLVDQLHGPLSEGCRYPPGLRLTPMVAGSASTYPAETLQRFALDKQGRFEITGIPSGNWKVVLCWQLNGKEVVAEVLELKEGESRELPLEVPQLVFAEVRGRVTHNGKPVSGGNLTLKKDLDAHRVSRWENAALDVEGRFQAFLVPDDYDLVLQLKSGQTWTMIPARDRLQLQPGQQVQRDFDVRSRVVRLRVVGPDGKPRAGVELRIGEPGGGWFQWLDGTDAKGGAEFRIPLDGRKIFAWPKAMMEPTARQEFSQKHSHDPGAWERAAILVGEFAAGGGDVEVGVELPAAAGY